MHRARTRRRPARLIRSRRRALWLPVEQRAPQRPHRQHRGRVIAEPERRRRARCATPSRRRRPRTAPTPGRSRDRHRSTSALRDHARCRRPTRRPRRIATPTGRAVCRRGVRSTTSTSSPSEVHSSTRVSRPRAPRWRRRRATTAHRRRARRRLRSPRRRARALVDASQGACGTSSARST